MLKFIFLLIFLTPLCFLNYFGWWMVQVFLVLASFFFMISLNKNLEMGMIGYKMGVDNLSFNMMMLSWWIGLLMLMASESVIRYKFYENLFMILLIFMLLFLLLSFSSVSMFNFYLYFEASLIPTVLMILGWGYQPERLEAGMYLLFYTLFMSLPLLVSLFMVYESEGTLIFLLFKKMSVGELVYMGLMMAFLVKMPMFLVHLWLPKAHVEAPVAGSMILAGVLLKLGGYGLLRVMKLILVKNVNYGFMIVSISLVGGFLISLICLRQIDLKSLIAYSSVAHMSIVLGGLVTMGLWGFQGSMALMVGHGLCSSGLFYLSNVVYERLGSRSMLMNKGVMNFMPSMALWWFLLSSSNMAAPPSLNLLGEISLFNSLVGWSWTLMILLMLMSFFSAAYSLYLYSSVQHGKIYSGMYSCGNGTVRDYLVVFLHWVPLNLLILKGDVLMLWI